MLPFRLWLGLRAHKQVEALDGELSIRQFQSCHQRPPPERGPQHEGKLQCQRCPNGPSRNARDSPPQHEERADKHEHGGPEDDAPDAVPPCEVIRMKLARSHVPPEVVTRELNGPDIAHAV